MCQCVDDLREFLELISMQIFIWWSFGFLTQELFSGLLEFWESNIDEWLVSLLISLTPSLVLVDSLEWHSTINEWLLRSVTWNILLVGLDVDSRLYRCDGYINYMYLTSVVSVIEVATFIVDSFRIANLGVVGYLLLQGVSLNTRFGSEWRCWIHHHIRTLVLSQGWYTLFFHY